jgi:4-alpha-glucanotransferase
MDRRSGVLLHITSLPSTFGIGDLGPWAYRFADFLASCGQSYWQTLPLNPTNEFSGNSPYSSTSVFAGNVLLISPELLAQWGYLPWEELADVPWFPRERCDYGSAQRYKNRVLARAYVRFKESHQGQDRYDLFCKENAYWLDDFALYTVIKRHQEDRPWGDWEAPLRGRDAKILEDFRLAFADEFDQERFYQYLFFLQWSALKDYCNTKKIRLIGDMPIYASYDSVDVWTNPDIFTLGPDGRPSFVGGVPPDYFSPTGQLWGNPTYRWDVMREDGFSWWLKRFAHNLSLFDVVRIDHFRGFVGFWQVAAGATTATEGYWVEAPAHQFFGALFERFTPERFIAEDLGIITPDVVAVMQRFGLTGMRVLMFAFQEQRPDHPYLPHNYVPDCIAYTGTHDNNTCRGWFEFEATYDERQRLYRYLGREIDAHQVNVEFMRLIMMSSAKIAMVPMQDVLGFGPETRMNTPSVAQGNWTWRLLGEQLIHSAEEILRELTYTFGRFSC